MTKIVSSHLSLREAKPTIKHMSTLERLRAAAEGLARHPHDHGWRSLYELFLYGLHNSAPQLECSLIEAYEARPLSATHLLTLLGIALKAHSGGQFAYLASRQPSIERLPVLETVLRAHSQHVSAILLSRQNSFTCARRFLVPRVLLGAYFAKLGAGDIVFADLGTGLGVLPRQLNSRSQYDKFASDLIWPDGVPLYKPLPIRAALGVDRSPLPSLDWVHNCYGLSGYYDSLYHELQASLNDPEVQKAPVDYYELDLLDETALATFIREHEINTANLSYVLYEMEPERRRQVIRIVARELYPPALLVVTEPREELHREGCVVEVFCGNNLVPLSICFVSDGHFKGHVLPLDDYAHFTREYPIGFQSRARD